MVFLYALVPWVGMPIGYFLLDKEQDILEQFIANFPDVGFLGIVATVICLVVTKGEMLDVLDSKIAALVAGLGLVADLLCLLVFPHTEAITAWFRANGLLGNGIYLGILLLTVFVNRKAAQAIRILDRAEAPLRVTHKGTEEQITKAVDGVNITLSAKAVIAPLFIVPSIVMYIYDGMADISTERMSRLVPNLDVLHWDFAIKISCALLLIFLLRYFLPAILKKSPLGWIFLAGLMDLAALAFVWLLLERALYPLSSEGILSTILIYFPILIVSGFFHFYAYLFFLLCLLDFFSPGSVRAWRLSCEAAALAKSIAGEDPERRDLDKRLDDQERLLNVLDGTGPYTNEEALNLGKISTKEYLDGKVYRDMKQAELEEKRHG